MVVAISYSILHSNFLPLDDENRVVLSPCGAFKDDYVNASPLDVSNLKIYSYTVHHMLHSVGIQATKSLHCCTRYVLTGVYSYRLLSIPLLINNWMGFVVLPSTKFSVLFFFKAPVAKTLADFWRLIWQEHPPTIVMVTNLKEGEKVPMHVICVVS